MLKHCRFCKSDKIKFVLKKEDIHIFKCLDCGVAFLGNNLNDESIKALYGYYGRSAFSDWLSPITKGRYQKLLNSFEKYRKNNTIIDVGCGTGHFIQCATEKNWKIDGTEISDEAIKIAREKRQNVIKGDIASLDLRKEEYDIATLFELMEHAIDPEGIIKKLSYIVRPGGLVYITTPNYNSIMRRFLGNRWGIFHKEHLFYFTDKSLTALLSKYKFKIKKVRTENLSLKEISKIFKKSRPLDNAKIKKRQENLRNLTEKNILFFVSRKVINFILNVFKAGQTIYIFAEKKQPATGRIRD